MEDYVEVLTSVEGLSPNFKTLDMKKSSIGFLAQFVITGRRDFEFRYSGMVWNLRFLDAEGNKIDIPVEGSMPDEDTEIFTLLYSNTNILDQ